MASDFSIQTSMFCSLLHIRLQTPSKQVEQKKRASLPIDKEARYKVVITL